MGVDQNAPYQQKIKLNLLVVIQFLLDPTNKEVGWVGAREVPISHCFIPGQDTDCGTYVELKGFKPGVGELLVICRGCCSEFVLSLNGLI